MYGTHVVSELPLVANMVEQKGCKVIQMFVDRAKDKNENEKIKKYMERNGVICVVHASYTINCAQVWHEHSWWILQLVGEIGAAHALRSNAVVLHLGKQMGLSVSESYNNMYTALLYVHDQTREKYGNVKILLETSSGQGSELCFKLTDLAHFYRKLSKHKNEEIRERFGICIDTCHIFAAGYDLRTKEMGKIYLDNFNELIGLEHVKLVHVNDAKKELGSNVDRHANLGHGSIGILGIAEFVKFFIKLNVPLVLETPFERINEDLDILRGYFYF